MSKWQLCSVFRHHTKILSICILMPSLITLSGCSSIKYHDLLVPEIRSSGWVLDCQMDEVNWLVSANNDSTLLAKRTHDESRVQFYEDFMRDTSKWYYSLAVRAEKLTSDNQSPTVFGAEVRFDSLVVVADDRELVLNCNMMFQKRFFYSGSAYAQIEPIPIRAKAKVATLRLTVGVRLIKGPSQWDQLTVELPVAVKRLTMSPLNPWP